MQLDDASDPELIMMVRVGQVAAYEELFLRHREVAVRYARRIAPADRAEDLCAEAFAKVLDLLKRGKGPEVAFRAYLLTTVRTTHLNAVRAVRREDLVADHEPINRMVPVIEDPDARFDRQAAFRALAKLPERWQATLWMTAVEDLPIEEIGRRLGISANAVSSLAVRARAGLRRAYLAEHLQEPSEPECRRIVELLPGYLRRSLTARRDELAEAHLGRCRPCSTAAEEITGVAVSLPALH
ncbi:MAG: polymerase, sigma-24 subunit, subfamily [Marmoricola sp.]|nr:polymerase, sigma-24 subunit, subfamily [Marmoricola sp.]